jgi:hypothetical protein
MRPCRESACFLHQNAPFDCAPPIWQRSARRAKAAKVEALVRIESGVRFFSSGWSSSCASS